MNNHAILIFIGPAHVMAALFVTAAACGASMAQSTTPTAATVPVTTPATIPATGAATAAPAPVVAVATVEAFWSADLYAKTSGYVSEVKADIGDAVKKGQVLAVIDAPEVE